MKKILRVSWIAKKTSEWVLNKTGVRKELSKTVKAKKLAYYGYTMRKQRIELPGERDSARNNAGCTQARKTTHSLNGQHQDVDRLTMEESIRMSQDRVRSRCCQPSGLRLKTAEEQLSLIHI